DAVIKTARVVADAEAKLRAARRIDAHLRVRRYALTSTNLQEAEHLLGRPLRETASVIEGARELGRRGVSIVVISMGARGAVCVSGGRTWLVHPPTVERRSTVGSGDSFVAGLGVALVRGL